MRILYLDCLRGINAIASLASLIDAGPPASQITRRLRFLPGGCTLRPSHTVVDGLRVMRIELDTPEVSHSARLNDIRTLMDASGLSLEVGEFVFGVYQRLAAAEARVHGSTIETVSFQEVGAARSVVAIIGAALALEMLGPVHVVASPLPAGGGIVETHHGRLPVPAPATTELLRDLPVQDTGQMGELVTPTGVALVSQIASSFGPMPRMIVERVGQGIDDQRTPVLLTRVLDGHT
ncbi:MAG: LarC family nickel insertion protein [Actinomycetota bacterium]